MSDETKYPYGFSLAEMDTEAFFNMREWLRTAIVDKGAKPDGSGIGMGQADISFELDGGRYLITIQPLPPTPKPDDKIAYLSVAQES